MRYTENGTVLGYCNENFEITDGQLLQSNSVMLSQKSCKPDVGNAGNYYSWPAVTAGGYHITSADYNELNSVCSSGWQMTVNDKTNNKSWYNLLRTVYNSGSNDSKIRFQPLSFIRSGNYSEALNNREASGRYWTATAKGEGTLGYRLFLSSTVLTPQDTAYLDTGFTARCVSR